MADIGIGELAGIVLLGGGVLLLPVLAVVDIARGAERWTWRQTTAVAVVVVGGPIAAALMLLLNRFGSRRGATPASRRRPHPLLPHVDDLRQPYEPVERGYDPTQLVRWALARLDDAWADRAMTWLEQGLPSEPVHPELAAVVAEPRRPQALRDRAARLLAADQRTCSTS